MEFYFNEVLAAVKQDVCYAQYSKYELTIVQGAKKLNAWYDNQNGTVADVYLQAFLEECSHAKCDDATSALAGAVSGNSGLFGCDMMEILYSSDVDAGFF